MRRITAAVVLSIIIAVPANSVGALTAPLPKDGPAPCSAGNPPYGWHGGCATYNGRNTWYGSHGPGFPSPLGWAICAERPASGGAYPAPGYHYALSSAPPGSSSSRFLALGWAFSEVQRRGWWSSGNPGSFNADQLAVAAKLLYDNSVWGIALPSLDAATKRALDALKLLLNEAAGITAPPVVTIALQGGGTTVQTAGSINVSVVAPGSNAGLGALPVTLTLTAATFDANHARVITLSTNAGGLVSAPFTTDSQSPSTVTARADVTVAQPGLLFYGPTAIITNAQVIVAMRVPVSQRRTLTLSAEGVPTGTLSVQKTGDDPAYVSVEGAVFDVLASDGTVLDTLETDASGATRESNALPLGNYVIHERAAPVGFTAASDQIVTVLENQNVVLNVGPEQGDAVQRGSISLTKTDHETAMVLAGAVYSVTFDPSNQLVANGPTFECTTNTAGVCAITDLLPGNYLVREVAPPPYYVASGLSQWVHVGPAETLQLAYTDRPHLVYFLARKFNAANSNPVPGAVYDLYAIDPGPPTAPPVPPADAAKFAGMTFRARASTNASGQLTFVVRAGFAWCLHEVSVPAEYVLDPALHCTSVISRSASKDVSLGEAVSSVTLQVHKFTAGAANTGVPGALYALFVANPFPVGFNPPPAVTGLVVPDGYNLWALERTDTDGRLTFQIPAGHVWCVREQEAPLGFTLDPALHCTGVVDQTTPSAESTVAITELAFTGVPPYLIDSSIILLGLGTSMILATRRKGTKRS